MSLVQTLPIHSEPRQSKTSQFTCISCQAVFPSSELQRAHYRTDWHKYNLKRKMADLAAVTAYQFNEKVLAQQIKGQDEKERAGIIFCCAICRKSYATEQAYENHMRSKKHRDNEMQQEALPHEDTQMTGPTGRSTAATTPMDYSATFSVDEGYSTTTTLRCLFCNENQDQFDANLHHMSKCHGFFLPDAEYLVNAEGLVQYLSTKIQTDFSCLYCNKELKSAQAAMTHMVDKGHCKMAYDESEDVDALLQYYDFGTMTDDDSNEAIVDTEKSQNGELVLQNGIRLGNRRLLKHYRRKQRSNYDAHDDERSNLGDEENDDSSKLSIISVMDQRETQQIQHQQIAWKNRQERRHPNLAISNGEFENHQSKTASGIKEAAKKMTYQYHVGVKNNASSTLRFRTHNPI
ncbi:C2H2 type zinc-finger-domain-containing protein [Absidia repens]|uniref:C2H2 type zinc-finger-domain-containing protein n=1 Tax=Absidia repens TaxID=90262 RepID=A0A1X2IZY8_9FUNG|nr:C2H2 type zinc-finger-domain-containing protein [Absidia repens]